MKMNLLIILFTLAVPEIVMGQETVLVQDNVVCPGRFESKKYGSLLHVESRVDKDRKVCRYFIDREEHIHYIFLEQEVRVGDSVEFISLDTIQIVEFPENGLIIIGSNELEQTQSTEKKVGFVISLEWFEGENIPDNSIRIIRAWSNGKGENKFIELNPNEIVRYNEGFYTR